MATRAILVSLLLVSSIATVSASTWTVPMDAQSKMSETLQAQLVLAKPGDPLAIIVQYDSFAARDAIQANGLPIAYTLYSIPAHFVWATPEQVLDLAGLRGVQYVEHNDPIEYDMDTAIVAANVAPLWASTTPSITINGTKIDGK